jgi:hypothetical protein
MQESGMQAARETFVGRDAKKTVAVVVPLYREKLTADEEISIRHLKRFLGDYDKYLVVPEKLKVTLPGFETKRFRDEFFHNTVTYSALLISPDFYRAFAEYEYILVYQTDALVFSDQLALWCATGIDYIGAPWLKGEGVNFIEEPAVGNGGLSLRRVESFLRVTSGPGMKAELDRYWEALYAAKPAHVRLLNLPKKILRRLRALVTAGSVWSKHLQSTTPDPGERFNEDCFWSFRAVRYDPGFQIASVAEALRFSFEVDPKKCYELNNQQLPFGCHGWNKYDRGFWEPFLLR